MQRAIVGRYAAQASHYPVVMRSAASPAQLHSSTAVSSAFGVAPIAAVRGAKTDKMIAGCVGATMSSAVVIGTFHLIVVKVPLMVAAGTILGSSLSGILAAFEGGEGSGGGAFGSAIGIFFGCIGAYYAKTSTEPWRK
jgi:hypothetical protein